MFSVHQPPRDPGVFNIWLRGPRTPARYSHPREAAFWRRRPWSVPRVFTPVRCRGGGTLGGGVMRPCVPAGPFMPRQRQPDSMNFGVVLYKSIYHFRNGFANKPSKKSPVRRLSTVGLPPLVSLFLCLNTHVRTHIVYRRGQLPWIKNW